MAVPEPFAPAESMKYSAPCVSLLPVVESSTVAVTVGALFVGVGAMFSLDVTGPLESVLQFAVAVFAAFIVMLLLVRPEPLASPLQLVNV
jgi:hypothetical protein